MHEKMQPGVYLDPNTDAIWRKTTDGSWTVDGRAWEPFPKALTHLRSIVSGPAVSVADAIDQPRITHRAAYVTDETFDEVYKWFVDNAKDIRPDRTWLGKIVVVSENTHRSAKGWFAYSVPEFQSRFNWKEINAVGFALVEHVK